MADKYLELIDGVITEREAITYSHGWQDAGKIPALEDDGRLSMTMMPKDVATTLNPADHGYLLGLTDNDHPQYLLVADIDDTPVDSETAQPISSNWAFDHVAAADPHTGYRLESADHSHQTTGLQGGKIDHGLALDGLSDPDHVVGALSFTATDKLAGRLTAGAGAGEEIACTAAGRALLDDANAAAQIATLGLDADIATLSLPASTTITVAGAALIDDVDTATQRATLGLGSLAVKNTVATADIDADAVTYARIQNISATDKVLGRATAGAGDTEEIACTAAARSILDDATVGAILTTVGGVSHSLATAANDFLVASEAGTFVKKTKAETQAIIGGSGLDADTLDTLHAVAFPLLAGRAGGQTLIGGTGVEDILKLQGTSGNGTATSPAIQLLVGNNGATVALTALNNGKVFVASNFGIGVTPGSHMGLQIQGTITSPDHAFGMYMGGLVLQPANNWAAFCGYMGGATISVAAGESVVAYGEYVESMTKSGTGTISATYGLYLRPQTIGTTNWGLYVESNNSYFGGNVGIGMSPTVQFELSGSVGQKASGTAWSNPSDSRLKTNIQLADLDLCYEIVKNIPLKRYTLRDEYFTIEQARDRSKIGWIADDVKSFFPKSTPIVPFSIKVQDGEEEVKESIDGEDKVITRPKFRDEVVIKDCMALDSDQIYAAMYGALQKTMLMVEELTKRVGKLEGV